MAGMVQSNAAAIRMMNESLLVFMMYPFLLMVFIFFQVQKYNGLSNKNLFVVSIFPGEFRKNPFLSEKLLWDSGLPQIGH